MNQKISADRVRSAQQVLAVVEVHGDALAAGLGETLGEAGAIRPFIAALADRIREAADALEAAAVAHEDELNDDAGPRAARDALVEAVYARIVQVRQIVGGAFGREALVALGQIGRLVDRPDRVASAGKSLVANLPRVLSQHTPSAGLSVDVDALLGPLADDVRALSEAIAAVDREAREAVGTLVARDAALKAHDTIFGRSAATLSALFRLAGMDALARRVRPSNRRAGRVERLDGEPADPTDGADADLDAEP